MLFEPWPSDSGPSTHYIWQSPDLISKLNSQIASNDSGADKTENYSQDGPSSIQGRHSMLPLLHVDKAIPYGRYGRRKLPIVDHSSLLHSTEMAPWKSFLYTTTSLLAYLIALESWVELNCEACLTTWLGCSQTFNKFVEAILNSAEGVNVVAGRPE